MTHNHAHTTTHLHTSRLSASAPAIHQNYNGFTVVILGVYLQPCNISSMQHEAPLCVGVVPVSCSLGFGVWGLGSGVWERIRGRGGGVVGVCIHGNGYDDVWVR